MNLQKIVSLALCLALVLCLGACSSGPSGVLSLEEISALDRTYGKSFAGTLEAIGVREDQLTQWWEDHLWVLPKPRKIQGRDFQAQIVRWESAKLPEAKFGGYMYRIDGLPDAPETYELIGKICEEGEKLYGEEEPSNRTGADWRERLETVKKEGFPETYRAPLCSWNLGEYTYVFFAAYLEVDKVGMFLQYTPDSIRWRPYWEEKMKELQKEG